VSDSLVFVYGTLKRGHANHHWLAEAPYRGEASLAGAVLHDLGPFPMAIPGEGRIHGEVYAVDPAQLARLDRLEGVPRLYERMERTLDDGRRAWVYLGRPRQVRHVAPISSGLWPRLMTLALLLLPLLWVSRAAAELNTLAACRAWQRSSGDERIRRGNAIGAAHVLTKVRRHQESSEDEPIAHYSVNDLRRVCSTR
jgi:gamma-glutamylcyclotransferase (GGCT)/AIG2-like uncharacterized protein YtfP